MKYRYSLPMIVTVFLVFGCSENPINSTDNNKPDNTQFAVAKSESVARDGSTATADQVAQQAQSINAFAVAMYQQLISKNNNLFFSPYSITTALAMTAAGAEGETKQQIRDALQVTLEGTGFDAAINNLDLALTGYAETTEGVTLNVVNSSWMEIGWDFRVSYLDHLSRYYGAGVNLMDFVNKPEECRTIINTWVANKTNQKIMELLPDESIDPATVLVLTNAIYFLGDWLYSFNPELTNERAFTLPEGSTIQTPIMSLNKPDEQVGMYYSRVGKARALDFPYKGNRLAMTVLLPDQNEFAAFESSLSTEVINNLINALDSVELKVSLPKFEFTSGVTSLVEPFKALGMIDAFEGERADFSGIDGTDRLYVDNIYHKAFISVDEKGTEAAAATAVVLVWESVSADEVIFNVDRPFIYLIRDKETGTILFIGRVLNPSVTEGE